MLAVAPALKSIELDEFESPGFEVAPDPALVVEVVAFYPEASPYPAPPPVELYPGLAVDEVVADPVPVALLPPIVALA